MSKNKNWRIEELSEENKEEDDLLKWKMSPLLNTITVFQN